MYWLLLPVDANTRRQLVDENARARGYWVILWARLQDALRGAKLPDA
jgi:hypothetical protein